MRKFVAVAGAVAALFLLSWLVCTALGVLTPAATRDWLFSLGAAGATAAVFVLLVADLLLPVPSTVVLSAGGIVLGWPLATAAGAAGLVLGNVAGYAAGRAFGRLAVARLVSPAEAERFGGWLDRFGPLALVVSRPVPMMAETLCCLAGLGRMRAGRFLAALLLGTLPFAWFFAFAGDRLGRVREEPGAALLVALAVPAAYWLGFAIVAGRRARRSADHS